MPAGVRMNTCFLIARTYQMIAEHNILVRRTGQNYRIRDMMVHEIRNFLVGKTYFSSIYGKVTIHRIRFSEMGLVLCDLMTFSGAIVTLKLDTMHMDDISG